MSYEQQTFWIKTIPTCKIKRNKTCTYISTNQYYSGMHWTVRRYIGDAWHETVKAALNFYDILAVDYPVKLKFYWNNRFDLDNNAVMRKMIIDSLVLANILPDDTKKYIKSISEYIYEEEGIRIDILKYT